LQAFFFTADRRKVIRGLSSPVTYSHPESRFTPISNEGVAQKYLIVASELRRFSRPPTNPLDTAAAVSFGVSSTARIITGAALIIVAVFAGFARGELVMFQQMGFGVAVALLLDATVVRSVLLPSAMGLLNRWNWYLPRWLRWLPRLQVERAPALGEGRP
jgi:MMPL family